MEFRMLGPFEAWQDGIRLDLGDLQQRCVLLVLLLHANRPVPTERLIDILWAGREPPRTNLIPGYVARLRKTFQAAGADDVTIDTTPTGYVLRTAAGQLDTERFGTLCAAAAEERRAGRPGRATTVLHEAIGLWRGAFLEDIDIDRIGGIEVVSLDEARLDALGDLAELELAAGNHRWVRDRLRPELRTDPGRPRIAALLMRALLAGGDRAKAMEVYRQTAAALAEFEVEPSAELRDLARLARYRETRTVLPPRQISFTGRERELDRIQSMAGGVVWISGMPGIGKTALAVHAAYRLRSSFPDAQVLVSLNGFTPCSPPTEVAEALSQVLLALGVPAERIPAETSGKVELYHASLDGTRSLIVLDNVASEEQIRPLLPAPAGCLVIVTSRAAGDHETGYLRLEPMPEADAARLFGALAGTDRLRGEDHLVDEVVKRCGRVPLQIKVVASQFRRHPGWPLKHLLVLLDEAAFDDAGTGACLVSYQQLTEAQRTLFRLFATIPGPSLAVPGAAALAATDPQEARGLLDELYALSLLEETQPERYHMLDPLRSFALSVKSTVDETAAGAERLLDFYLVATAAAIATVFPFDQDRQPAVDRKCRVAPAFPERRAALEWLATERPNLVAAIGYAADHGHREHTWRLAVLLWRYFYVAGHLRDWSQTLELAREAIEGDPANRYGLASVLLRLSGARWRSGDLPGALSLAGQALPLWVELGDVDGESNTLCAIAMAKLAFGDHDQAMWSFQAALTKYERIGDRRGQANVLSNLGHLNEVYADLALAERQHLSATRLLRELDNLPGLVHALDNLGCVRRRLGRLDDALADHTEARRLAVEIGDRSGEAYALNNIGVVRRLRGALDDALRCHDEASLLAEDVADPNLLTQLRLDRGATQHARGKGVAALADFRAALDLAAGTGDRGLQAHAHHGIAQVLHDDDRHEQAARHWQAAITGFDEVRQPEGGQLRRDRAALGCGCLSGQP